MIGNKKGSENTDKLMSESKGRRKIRKGADTQHVHT
jgi:hypothetical protein